MKVSGKTKTGLAFDIDTKVIKDVRFLRAVKKMSSKKENEALDGSLELQNIFFPEGSEAERELFDHVATPEGYVEIDAVFAEIGDIIGRISEEPEEKK